MATKLWFVHRDCLAEHRYSDGVRLCVVPRLEGRSSGELGSGERGELGERICFYCDEYQLLWDSLETVGQIKHAVPDNPCITIRAATLPEICAAGLCEFINAVVEVDGLRTTAHIRLR